MERPTIEAIANAKRWREARRLRRRRELGNFFRALSVVCLVAAAVFLVVTFMHWLETPAMGFPAIKEIPSRENWSIYVRLAPDDTRTYNGATYHSEAECELALHSSMMKELTDSAHGVALERYGTDEAVTSFCALNL